MSAVTKQEIINELRGFASIAGYEISHLADRIEQHGIAPPDNVKQADEETHRRVDEAVRNGRIVDKRAPEVKP